MADRIGRGQIRLCEFPAPDKTRPVLVLTRPKLIGLLATVVVAPITSTIRGVPTEVSLSIDDGMKVPCCVNLANLYTIHKVLLGRLVGTLSVRRMDEVCRAACFSLGCTHEAEDVRSR